MKTKKDISESVKYSKELNIKRAKISGNALKAPTARGDFGIGIYPVGASLNGTGTVTRILLSSALKRAKKKISDKVTGKEISEAYNRIEENGFKNPLGVLYEKEVKRLPKSYGNYKTLKNRLLSEINSGAILGFTFKSPEDSEVVSIFGKVNA